MSINQIVCCTDFSENSLSAFKMAVEMAEKYHSDLTLLHVLPLPVNPMFMETEWMTPEIPMEAITLKIEQRMNEEYGSKVPANINYRTVILDGHVSSEILKYLEDHPVDVIVLGAYGLTGMELVFFGSVAKRVAHKAPCSVLIARERKNPI
jgi:universal stress protein A